MSAWHIDPETLRDHSDDPEALAVEVETADRADRVWMLRRLGLLDEARTEGIALLGMANDRFRPLLLLADVYRWLDCYDIAAQLQREALTLSAGTRREAVARQHIGKRLFDEGRYSEAASEFELALSLRKEAEASADLIESSRLARSRAVELSQTRG